MDKKIHLICNAHIDPIWQWSWDEGLSAAISTFKSACDLLDEYDFVFCHNESLLYKTIEEIDPILFSRIQKHVQNGKWIISGGWFIQPDCNMPLGETFIRIIETGKKYFKEKFNVDTKVAYNFDSFGHSLGLVQILKKSGFVGYMHCRPNMTQFNYPGRFYKWKAPDGSFIDCAISNSYSSLLGKAVEKIIDENKGAFVSMIGSEAEKSSIMETDDVSFTLWGVGNHGGGPSRIDLQNINNLKLDGYQIIHSDPDKLFNDSYKVKGEIDKSLLTVMPGCYSSMMRVKQAFKRVESLFYNAEKMISSAILQGLDVDFSSLNEIQENLMIATFHDTLPGTVVAEAEIEALDLILSAEKKLKDLRTHLFLKLSNTENIAAEGEYPIAVFNYNTTKKTQLIEAEFSLADQNWDLDFVLMPHVYKNGVEINSQCIKENSTLNLDWRKRIIFEAELEPLMLNRFSVFVEKVARKAKFSDPIEANISQELPYVASLEMYDDTADPWGMSKAELKEVGHSPKEFRKMSVEEIKKFVQVESSLPCEHLIESGSVLNRYETFYTLENTKAVIQYTKYKNLPYEDIKVIIEYGDKNKLIRLKLPIPNKFIGGQRYGDGPFINEIKPDCENVFQKWYGVKKDDEVFAVLNDCLYAGKQDENFIYLTLLRGSGYCFHPIGDAELYPHDRYLPRIESGRYEYNFRILNGSIFDISEEAEIFNNKPYAQNVFPTNNGVKNDLKFTINGEILLVCAKPISQNKIIFRFYNPKKETTSFVLNVNNNKISIDANINEIVTILFDNNDYKVLHNSFWEE